MQPMAQTASVAPTAPVPPQNLDAEESVLGAMMLSPGAIGAVSEVLSATRLLPREPRQDLPGGARPLRRGEPVDAITLVDELERRGELEEVGGKVRIHELAALVPATANAGHYARIVREMATLRGLIRAGRRSPGSGWTARARRRPSSSTGPSRSSSTSRSRGSRATSPTSRSCSRRASSGSRRCTSPAPTSPASPSGFRDLDKLTSGFQPGNLIILAARPSMGKSGLALCIAANLAVRQETPVALFTLEMSKSEVTQRLMCSEAKVESQRLRTGNLAPDDWPRLTAACDRLAKAPIYVDDTGSITMMEIRSKARRLKMREPNLGLIIVDYLQLMTSGSIGREPRAGGVADLALAEGARARPRRARSSRSRSSPAPSSSGTTSGRSSPTCASPARSSRTPTSSCSSTATSTTTRTTTDQQGLAEVHLAKHRNGPTDSIKLSFLKRFAKFADLGGADRGGGRRADGDTAGHLGQTERECVRGTLRGV